MSDMPQGWGWWQASDWKWYPPESPAPGAGAMGQSSIDGTAIAALVLGIASIPFCLFIVVPILAIVLGVRGRQNVAANPAKTGRGFATAGVVLGIVGLALLVGFFMLVGASNQS